MSDLENIGEKIADWDQAVILLNSLSSAYGQIRDTIRYNKESLTMDELEVAIRSKEMELKHEKKNGNGAGSNNEALNVRGRSNKRDGSKVHGKSRSKSKKPGRKRIN